MGLWEDLYTIQWLYLQTNLSESNETRQVTQDMWYRTRSDECFGYQRRNRKEWFLFFQLSRDNRTWPEAHRYFPHSAAHSIRGSKQITSEKLRSGVPSTVRPYGFLRWNIQPLYAQVCVTCTSERRSRRTRIDTQSREELSIKWNALGFRNFINDRLYTPNRSTLY